MTDVGLYVHVPFCPRKCGYCDFYSIVPHDSLVADYIDAVLSELDAVLAEGRLRVKTLFVGGGTPTFLPGSSLARLMERLAQICRAHRVVEFSVEANPASLTEEKVLLLRQAGVNRISIGAQSFVLAELEMLERLHRPEDIVAGVELVRRAGFEHLNLDLIFGIPGQTLHTWNQSLEAAIDLGPDHVACYGLTYEPGTPLVLRRDSGQIIPIDEEVETEMYMLAIDRLAEAGFQQYEISNFARPGGQCQHNLRYWRSRPGIGVGAAAASYLNGCRWRNVVTAEEYISRIRAGRSTAVDVECLTPVERAGEVAMLRLRTSEGIVCDEFRAETGYDAQELFAEAIRSHCGAGLLLANRDRIALTRKGLLVADAVVRDFLKPFGC
ncbi:MAG: radical SAM family heme chaperone HemW [Phycisphaerae bacterium]